MGDVYRGFTIRSVQESMLICIWCMDLLLVHCLYARKMEGRRDDFFFFFKKGEEMKIEDFLCFDWTKKKP